MIVAAGMGEGHEIDGTLRAWDEVEETCLWDTLLVGNGLSRNVWPDFGFSSLYDKAVKGTRHGGLGDEDRQLFEALETRNFERVLAELNAAILVARVCEMDPTPFEQRYRSIQDALGAAVRSVHLEHLEVSDDSLRSIRNALREFECVFTTSYDLIAYWAIALDGFDGFCDCFWANDRNEFDPEQAEIRGNPTPVFFLHGALHLLLQGSGVTRKLKRDDKALIQQFGAEIPDDPEARPLLVSEGSSKDKLLAIEANDYLAHALRMLQQRGDPLVVFGHRLGDQDRHLVEAINRHPDRPVAVSVRPGPRGEVRARQGEVRARLDTEQLLFFDSTTHPLGADDLRAERLFKGSGGMFGRR
jgi:hypothetical protein